MANAKRLAKNTIYMYIRMIFIMGVSIYTSRVLLDKLGVDDYGLYNAVASVVSIVAFVNMTLSTSTLRFLTFDLGKGDNEKMRVTFATAFWVHMLLAIMIVVLMETIGLWYMHTKFVIPEGRELATHITFQLSILMTAASLCLVPYTSLILAHEDMYYYAYISIVDVVAKLFIVYIISISFFDKLITYASLVLAVQIVTALIYFVICRTRYFESKLTTHISKTTFKEMMGFSGWTALGNLSNTLTIQGAILILNLFFVPAIIAAKAVADQITSAILQFVANFRTALNPQIIKSFSTDNIRESESITLKTTVISFDLILIIGLPFIFTAKTILSVWLVEVPPMAVEFTQLAVLTQLFGTISTSTYIAFVSTGKLRNNAIYGIIYGFVYFVVLYCIFTISENPLWVQLLKLIFTAITFLIVRPFLLYHELGFKWINIFTSYWQCCKVFMPATIISYGLSILMPEGIFSQFLLFIEIAIVCLVCAYLFMEKGLRQQVNQIVINKLNIR